MLNLSVTIVLNTTILVMLIKYLTKIGAYTFYVVGQRLGHHVLIQNVCEKIDLVQVP